MNKIVFLISICFPLLLKSQPKADSTVTTAKQKINFSNGKVISIIDYYTGGKVKSEKYFGKNNKVYLETGSDSLGTTTAWIHYWKNGKARDISVRNTAAKITEVKYYTRKGKLKRSETY